MTTQAMSRAHRLAASVAHWIGYAGALCAFLLLSMVLLMPLGHMVFDYWTPKVQSVWQPAPVATKAPQKT